jgi:polysaccharide biosynthesis transport protein
MRVEEIAGQMTQNSNMALTGDALIIDRAAGGSTMFARSATMITPLLIKYFQIALRWRWLIAAIIATCLAIGVITLMLAPSVFTAQSQIEISREQKNITSVEGLNSGYGGNSEEFYDTQYQLLRAGSLAERVARDMKLADDASFFAAHGVDLGEAKVPLSAADRKSRESWAAGMLMGGIQINPIRNSSLVNIAYSSQSPAWSARIANAWPQGYIAATLDRGLASTADARQFLEGRLNDLRSKLAKSESDLITFAGQRGIVTLGPARSADGKTDAPQTLVATNLSALNTALMAARTERIAAESRARSPAGENSAEMLQNAAVSTLRARRTDVAAEYARVLVQFEPGYPTARALKAQLDTLDVAIRNEMRSVQGSRQVFYSEALKRENELAAQVNGLKAQFDQQQRDTIQYNVYQREVDTNRQLYDSLLQRYKEIGLSGSVGTTNIAIVDPAKAPGGPSAPNVSSYMIMALLAGVGLSIAAILGLEQIDSGVRSPDDIEQLFNLALLGNVPRTEGDVLTELDDPKSDASEAFQSARAVLSFSTSRGLPATLLVTSARASEGKSTSTYALAMAIARSGKRVLLVDADMRSPSIHKMIGCKNSSGLSNILTGEDVLATAIVSSKVKGLSVLPAGPKPPSTAELLSAETLGQIFERLQAKYDHVLVDGPPVLGMADAPIIGAATEAAVFVIEAEKTPIRAVKHALERLRLVNANVVGVIVSKIDYGRHGLGYGYGYGYGSGYGYDYGKDSSD